MTLRFLVDGEHFAAPLRGYFDQCGAFSELLDSDLHQSDEGEIMISICDKDVFRILLQYLTDRASSPPRKAVTLPLPSFDFRANVDPLDADFVEALVPPASQGVVFCDGVHKLMQLLSLATFLQYDHLRHVCAAYIVCSACGRSDDVTRAQFGLPSLGLDERQNVIDELHFFARNSF